MHLRSYLAFILLSTCQAWWLRRASMDLFTKGKSCLISLMFFLYNRLPKEDVQFPALEVFRIQLDQVLSSAGWPEDWPCFEQWVGLETSWDSFQTELTHNSVKSIFSGSLVCIFLHVTVYKMTYKWIWINYLHEYKTGINTTRKNRHKTQFRTYHIF